MDFSDPRTLDRLGRAAEIVTRNLDRALEECTADGLSREIFSAAVMATLMQAMQTSLGSAAPEAMRDMIEMMAGPTTKN